MLDFDVKPVRFRVNGVGYQLSPMSLDDAARMAQYAALTQAEQILAMRELIADAASSRTPSWVLRLFGRLSPAEAVRALGPVKQAHLFGEWIADYRSVSVGESSGSDVS